MMDDGANDPAWLQQALEATRHVDDDGFTDRVVARLPARRARFSARAFVVLTSTVAGCALAAFVVGREEWARAIAGAWRFASFASPLTVLVALLAMSMVGAAAAARRR